MEKIQTAILSGVILCDKCIKIMRTKFLVVVFISLFLTTKAQKFTITGYVSDANTGESLIGASVYVKNPLRGTTTNAYGFYSITLDKGNYTLHCDFLGYSEFSDEIVLEKNLTKNIKLLPSAYLVKEVVITGEGPDKNIQSTDIGTFEMPVEMVKKLPAVFGEVDILKTLQLKPGIQSGGEGMTAFYVRGGGPDQNLILLDEAVVYNASHLFGFFSVFNADAIQNVEIHKGHMPANYSGRLASVLDISMKEGNNQKFGATGGLGLLASRLTVEGPLKKDTSSFIISGRRTYVDFVIKPFVNKESSFRESFYYFYDLNAKLNYRFSDRSRLFASSYFGRDIFDLVSTDDNFNNKIAWGNATAVVRWNYLLTRKLFVNTSLIYSNYNFFFDANQDQYNVKVFSDIEDWNVKTDFTWLPSPSHTVKYGGRYTYHIFKPKSLSAKTGDVELDLGHDLKLYSHEGAIYVNDEFDITSRIRINSGLIYSVFSHVGPFDRYVKDPITNETTDTVKYKRGENVKTYHNLEPRLAMRFLIDEFSSVKAAYTQNYQYIHLTSLSPVTLPTDVWFPSTEIVKPQFGTQYSAGYFRNFFKNTFETSLEIYYKELKNQIEFKEGALIEGNFHDNAGHNFTFGEGQSYGLEFFLNKQYGRLTGWIGYTWSKTTRKFPDINYGEVFPAKYDRRHDISIVGMYEINQNINVSAVWVYATGNTATLPVSRYIIGGNIINEYGPRNSFRMPPYHRLDLSLNWIPKQKKEKRWKSSWNFSVYNAYNRKNPYYIYFETKGNISEGYMEIRAKQVSLFPVLPSVTYNFKF